MSCYTTVHPPPWASWWRWVSGNPMEHSPSGLDWVCSAAVLQPRSEPCRATGATALLHHPPDICARHACTFSPYPRSTQGPTTVPGSTSPSCSTNQSEIATHSMPGTACAHGGRCFTRRPRGRTSIAPLGQVTGILASPTNTVTVGTAQKKWSNKGPSGSWLRPWQQCGAGPTCRIAWVMGIQGRQQHSPRPVTSSGQSPEWRTGPASSAPAIKG